MRLSKHQLAVLSIILNTIIWSAAGPIFKWSLHDTPPFMLAFFRFFFATLIMLPFVYKKMAIKFEDFFKVLMLALVGITFNTTLFFFGLTLSPSINVPIIAATTPIMLIISAFIFLHEIPKSKVIVGTVISLIGVIIIIVRPIDNTTLFGSILGNIYFILSFVSFVSYTILLKQFKLPYSPSTLVFWIFLLCTITYLPPFFLEEQVTHSLTTLNLQGSIGIMYGAIFSSILGYYFYNYAAKYLTAGEIGLFSYLEPVATAMVALPLLHEQITFGYLFGSFFVFVGLFISESKLRYNPFQPFRAIKDRMLESRS